MHVATLAGSLAAATTHAHAQALVEERIDSAFEIVPGNSVDLAIPLSRRALARRSTEEEAEPLPYFEVALPPASERPGRQAADPVSLEPQETAAIPAVSPQPVEAAPPSASEIEEGSVEDSDTELARLPRPRPAPLADHDFASVALLGRPLDLVAGASVPVPAEPRVRASLELRPRASAEPQQLLQPPSELVATVAAPAEEPRPSVQPSAPRPVAQPAPDLTAAKACLALDKVADADGDFRRNEAALAGLCIGQEKFKERRRPWIVQTIDSGRPGPLWTVMHDDEAASFDNAVHALKTYGGVLLALETGGKRNQDGIDPNRNFSADGIGCSKLGDEASPRFTGAFSEHMSASSPIIALHNNYDGHVPTGGLGHVSMKTLPRDMRASSSNDPDGPLAGDYALVLVAASNPDDASVTSEVATLTGAGINVILEPVREDRADCSLSNYAVLTGHNHYFNVTVDHDEGDKQRRIVDVIMSGFSTVSALN